MPYTIDPHNRLILLDGNETASVRDIYSAWVQWSVNNLQWLPAFRTLADPPLVPVYATLINGWRVSPQAGDYTLIVDDGFLLEDNGEEPFAAAHGVGPEPRVRYSQPVIAVGFSTGSPQQADIDAIRATTDQIAIEAGRVLADIRAVNAVTITGSGVPGDSMRPAP